MRTVSLIVYGIGLIGSILLSREYVLMYTTGYDTNQNWWYPGYLTQGGIILIILFTVQFVRQIHLTSFKWSIFWQTIIAFLLFSGTWLNIYYPEKSQIFGTLHIIFVITITVKWIRSIKRKTPSNYNLIDKKSL